MIIVLLLSIGFGVALWQTCYYFMWKRELKVVMQFKQPFVYAGEQAELTEIVENRKKLPVSPVEVRFKVKKGIKFEETDNTIVSDYVYKRDIFSLLGNQRITRNLLVNCQKRGCYSIKEASVSTFSILHEKKYTSEQDITAQLYVYAKRTDVSAILQACENLLGEQESSRKYLEDPFIFSSIRSYTIQDPMKTINWKASAKTGELMVNTYSSMKSERMMIYLDVEDKGILKKEHLTEDSIAVAATLYQKLLSKGNEVGICINLREKETEGLFYLKPSRQKGQRTMLEQKLASVWKEEEVADFEKITEYPLEAEIPVIISKNVSEQRKQKMEEFLGKDTKGIWVIPYEKEEYPNVHSDRFLFVKREVAR